MDRRAVRHRQAYQHTVHPGASQRGPGVEASRCEIRHGSCLRVLRPPIVRGRPGQCAEPGRLMAGQSRVHGALPGARVKIYRELQEVRIRLSPRNPQRGSPALAVTPLSGRINDGAGGAINDHAAFRRDDLYSQIVQPAETDSSFEPFLEPAPDGLSVIRRNWMPMLSIPFSMSAALMPALPPNVNPEMLVVDPACISEADVTPARPSTNGVTIVVV